MTDKPTYEEITIENQQLVDALNRIFANAHYSGDVVTLPTHMMLDIGYLTHGILHRAREAS